MQKVLICHTEKDGMRDKVVGWSCENGDAVKDAWKERLGTEHEYDHTNAVPVGLIGGMRYHAPCYPTVLHALGDGWKLLAPPQRYEEGKAPPKYTMYEWWLVKE